MRIFNIFCSKPSKAKSKNAQRAHTKRAEDSNADSSCSPTPASSRSPDGQLFVDPSPSLANNDSVKQSSKSVSKAAAAAHTEKSHIPSGMFSIQFLYKNPLGRAIMQDHISQRMQQSGTIVKAKNCDDVREDAQLAQYVHSIPNALRYKGTLLQGYLVYPRVLAKIEQFQVRPDDIWVCTYPKSGTTWTEEILSLIVNDGDTDKTSKTLLAERVPHFEVGKPFGHMKWLNNIQASPRILATHLNTDCIPNQLNEAKAKIIYVVRNPKDTAVSYFHHHKMSSFLGNYSGTWDKYLQLFESGKLVYGDWFEHVRGFWQMAQTHPDQVLFISYEELKINLRGTIEMIGNFIGRPLSAATADKIAQQCTFEKMKNNAMVNREVLPLPDLFDMSNTKFMRKGIIGDWQSQFTPQQSQRFDEIFMPKLASIGLELAFDTEQALRMFQQCGRVLRSTVSASATFVPVDHASVTSDLGSSGSSDDEESNHADGSGDHQERASSSSSVSSTCGNSMGSFENETSGTPYCTDSSLHAHHKPTMTVQKAC